MYKNTPPVWDNPTAMPIVPTDSQNNNALLSGNTTTGSVVSGDVVSGSVDDTELPLDQQAGEDNQWVNPQNQESDPEVDEIINILEELIAESEQGN